MTTVGAAVLLGVLASSNSLAQSPAAMEPATESSAPIAAASLDETKLDKFVDAYVAVQGIQKEAMQKQSTATDQDAAKALTAETQAKMTDAVEKTGLHVDEFNSIAQLMVNDTDLRARVTAKLQQRTNVGG
jgi:hypothetical protein